MTAATSAGSKRAPDAAAPVGERAGVGASGPPAGREVVLRADDLRKTFRLGFFQGGNRGPWLLGALFRRHHQRLTVVNWDDVEDWDREHARLVLRMGAARSRATLVLTRP